MASRHVRDRKGRRASQSHRPDSPILTREPSQLLESVGAIGGSNLDPANPGSFEAFPDIQMYGGKAVR